MQDQERLGPAERELEQALAALRPASAKIDRDRLMFLAGRTSARRRSRLWQCAAGALAVALAAALSAALYARPAPREVERVVYVTVARPPAVPAEAPAAPIATPEPGRWRGEPYYLKLRDEVLAKGLDALPAPRGPAAQPGIPDRTRFPLLRLNDLLRGEQL